MDGCLRQLVRACGDVGDRFAGFLRLKGTFVTGALRAHTPPARTQNVRAFDEETADTPGCPVCSNVPGVQDSILQQGGIEAVVRRISGKVSGCAAARAVVCRVRVSVPRYWGR